MRFKVGDHVVVKRGDRLDGAQGVVTRTKRKTVHVQLDCATVPIRLHENEVVATKINNPEKLQKIMERIKLAKKAKVVA